MKENNKYKSEYADRLPEMFKDGESIAEIAKEFKICRATFYNWVRDNPDFKEAYAMGKTYSEAWWMKIGRGGAVGKIDINPSVWLANMRNRFDWDKPDKADANSQEDQKDIKITIEIEDGKKPTLSAEEIKDD